jgi:hypothetical protein
VGSGDRREQRRCGIIHKYASTTLATTTEINCFNGTDDDSDGQTDCADPDCNGATDGSCTTGQPGICSTGTLTCQNSIEECVADNEPQTEICGNGIDENCDGQDEECVADNEPQTEICGNGIDENCDGQDDICPFDCTDNDGDGYGVGADCLGPDCNDNDIAINPDTIWYQDNDGDGYGNDAISSQQCDQPGPAM